MDETGAHYTAWSKPERNLCLLVGIFIWTIYLFLIYRQSHCIALCFIVLFRHRIFFLTNQTFMATPCLACQLMQFFQQLQHNLCLCVMFCNSYNISNFLLLLHLLWCSVIIDLWCYYCSWWEGVCAMNHAHTRWQTSSINACALITPPSGHSPISLFLLNLPISWDTTVLKLGQLITLQWPLSVQVKERVTCFSL